MKFHSTGQNEIWPFSHASSPPKSLLLCPLRSSVIISVPCGLTSSLSMASCFNWNLALLRGLDFLDSPQGGGCLSLPIPSCHWAWRWGGCPLWASLPLSGPSFSTVDMLPGLYLDFIKFAIEKVVSHSQLNPDTLKSFPVTESSTSF